MVKLTDICKFYINGVEVMPTDKDLELLEQQMINTLNNDKKENHPQG
jgi:hypothetical protein